MMRRLTFLLALLACGPAWADTSPTMLPGRMPSLDQGRGGAATRFAPAPRPNPDLLAPTGQRDPNAVRVTPGLTNTRAGQALAGDGFARGSAYTGDLERRRSGGLGSTMVPSLRVQVPMQVEFR